MADKLLINGSYYAEKAVIDPVSKTYTPIVAESITNGIAMVVGTPSANAGRALQVICSVVGNISVTLAGGFVNVVPVVLGLNTFPWSVTEVNTSGTTATATYVNLY